MAEFEYTDLQGQTLTKLPGSTNGESFALKNLVECNVYLLDYTSEVEVTNCSNCNIFIGPVDGPAIFENVTDCQVAVACQQFQAKNCSNIDFGLYCATRPSVTSSRNLRFSGWVGAYPGLTAHFAAANLNPLSNVWSQVYDADDDEGSFEIVPAGDFWEVPIEGSSAPLENPVPAPNGSAYVPGGGVFQPPANRGPSENGGEADGGFGLFGGSAGGAVENGGPPLGEMKSQDSYSALAPLSQSVFETTDNPKVVAMREAMRDRLAKQESGESDTKQQLIKKAEDYLANYYEKRNMSKEQRAKDNREHEKLVAVKGPEGNSEWERTISLIDFNFGRPNGADLSRYKNVLFNAKSKNVPIAAGGESS